MILVPDFTRKVSQMSTSSFSELRDPILMIFFVKKSRQLGLDENMFGRGFGFCGSTGSICKHKFKKLKIAWPTLTRLERKENHYSQRKMRFGGYPYLRTDL